MGTLWLATRKRYIKGCRKLTPQISKKAIMRIRNTGIPATPSFFTCFLTDPTAAVFPIPTVCVARLPIIYNKVANVSLEQYNRGLSHPTLKTPLGLVKEF